MRGARCGIAVVAACLSVAGCGAADRPAKVALRVTPSAAPMDRAVRVEIAGLGAHGTATLDARWRSTDGTWWASSLPLRAGAGGEVVLRGLDGMRFLWSMRPQAGRPDFFATDVARPRPVQLTVRRGGAVLARARLVRRDLARGERHETLSVRANGLSGYYYAPASARRRPAVLALGGSNGGVPADVAALLAAHGYPALALSYFRAPGLPRHLHRIPLEYFRRALGWLRTRPGVDPRRVVVFGLSRGGEGALLIGATFPKLAHGVIATVPSHEVNGAYGAGGAAWTYRGRAIRPFSLIPVARIDGPVLVAGAGQDRLWESSFAVRQIEQSLRLERFRFAHRGLEFPLAGHDVGHPVPYEPQADPFVYGGTRRATAAAKVVLWRAILDYLRSMSSIR